MRVSKCTAAALLALSLAGCSGTVSVEYRGSATSHGDGEPSLLLDGAAKEVSEALVSVGSPKSASYERQARGSTQVEDPPLDDPQIRKDLRIRENATIQY